MHKSKYAEDWDFGEVKPITEYDIEHAEEIFEKMRRSPEEEAILRAEAVHPPKAVYPPA